MINSQGMPHEKNILDHVVNENRVLFLFTRIVRSIERPAKVTQYR